MRNMKRVTIVLLLLWAAIPLGLIARDRNLDSWDNLKQLRPGQKIEVVDMGMRPAVGTFVNVTDEGITLKRQNASGQMTVNRADVYRVTLHAASKRLRNALIGAGIIGAIVAVPAVITGIICSNEGGDCTGRVAGAIALGAGAGAGLGAAVPSYPTIYRAKRIPGGNTP